MKDFLGLEGVTLGPYVVRQVATMGGVAVIYRGEHATLHNAVAVKVLTPEVVQPDLQPTLEQLFLREAQILSQLRSDDILRAHHHGRVVCPADGAERSYLVVDWLEGRTLSDELDIRRPQRRAYSLPEVIELLEPIARALACAHASGIVHRDVNPRNVFLEYAGPDRLPRAKLIDFGFAKQVAETQILNLQRVAGTLLARSPDYSAPEHYDRDVYGELSESTDIYTFALMLVEALTLEAPLRGTTPDALRWATTNRQDRPTPRRRGAQVSDAVEELFMEALAVDQFDRPSSILEWWQRVKHAVNAGHAQALPGAVAAHAAYGQTPYAPAPGMPTPYAPPYGHTPHAQPPAATPGHPPYAHSPAAARPAQAPHAPAPASHGPPPYPHRQPLRTPAQPAAAPIPIRVHANANANANGDGRQSGWKETPLELEPAGVPKRGSRAIVTVVLFGVFGLAALAALAWWKLRPLECPAGFADCNGVRSDGCETNLASDPTHCGKCETACPTSGGTATCVASECKLSSCSAPYLLDCNGSIADGCEVDGRRDTKHCGACDVACGSQGAKRVACSDSKCELTCSVNFGNCDGDPRNGCETALANDPKHCGSCTAACSDTRCSEGLCLPAVRSVTSAEYLTASGGELYFYNPDAHTIESVGSDGKSNVLVDALADVHGIAVGSELLVWTAGNPSSLYARSRQSSSPERVAGPLLSATPLVVSSTGWLSWANRSAPPSARAKSRGKQPAESVPASGDVISVAIDRALEKSEFHTAQCGDWPKSFIADDRGQYCCNQAGPLTSLDCSAGACKGHPYPLSCSDDLVLDADQLFATQDTRIVAVDRASGQVKQLFRRKRHTRELHASATHLYWFEGDAQADLYRAPKTGTAAAELLARRQLAAEFLTIGDSGACWVAAAPRTELDFESASQKSSHAEAGATVTKAHPLELPHRAIYCLKTP